MSLQRRLTAIQTAVDSDLRTEAVPTAVSQLPFLLLDHVAWGIFLEQNPEHIWRVPPSFWEQPQGLELAFTLYRMKSIFLQCVPCQIKETLHHLDMYENPGFPPHTNTTACPPAPKRTRNL